MESVDRIKEEPGQKMHRDYINAKEIHDHEFLEHTDRQVIVNAIPKTIPNPFPIEPVLGRIIVLPIPSVRIEKIGSIHLLPSDQLDNDYSKDARAIVVRLPEDLDSIPKLKDRIKVGDAVLIAIGLLKPLVVVKGFTYLLVGEYDILGIQRGDTIPTEEEGKQIATSKEPPRPTIETAKN